MDHNPERRLAIIQDLAVRLLDAVGIEAVLASATASAIEQLGFHECVIYLWTEDTGCLVPRAARFRAPRTPTGGQEDQRDPIGRLSPLRPDQGIVGRVFRRGEAALVHDTSEDPDYFEDGSRARAELAVPIIQGKRCLGVIDAEDVDVGAFQESHREMLTLVASIIAPRIEMQHAFERLRGMRAALERSRAFVRELIDTAPNVLYLLDYETGRLSEGRDKLAAFLGLRATEFQSPAKGVYSLIHPDDQSLVAQQEDRLARGASGQTEAVEVRLRQGDGSYRWCLISSRVFRRAPSGRPQTELGSITDLSGVKAAEAAELAREKQLHALFRNGFDCIVLYDRTAILRYSTPSVERFTGYNDREVLGRSALDFVVEADHREGRRIWAELLERPRGHAILEQRIQHKDGRIVWIEARLTNLLDDPDVQGIVANFHDITARKEAEERINELANYDELTGLPNRRLLLQRLDEGLRTARETGRGLALLYMDLDRFKDVNDTLGHETGDRLLLAVARVAGSVVGDEGLVARLGGDEFALVLPGATIDGAQGVAGRLLHQIEAPLRLDGYEFRLTASVGIARYPEHGATHDALFKHADIAMYRAKGDRNRYSVFRAADARAMARRVRLEKDLALALDRDEFELWYQPRIDLASLTVVAVEALLRWRRDDGHYVPPGHFIPIAEETGLIYPIGEWVLREACTQAARWRDAGRRLRVSVNLSAHEISRLDIIDQVARALGAAGLDGDEIELELTESAALGDFEDGLETLHQLKRLGVRLAIDDFGTGHSSLSYLRRLPVDCLKIDQQFLQASTSDGRGSSQSLIAGIVLLAKSGGLRAVCEGVETEAQHRLLVDLGCDEAQGYLYARPLPAPELEAKLDLTHDPRRGKPITDPS